MIDMPSQDDIRNKTIEELQQLLDDAENEQRLAHVHNTGMFWHWNAQIDMIKTLLKQKRKNTK